LILFLNTLTVVMKGTVPRDMIGDTVVVYVPPVNYVKEDGRNTAIIRKMEKMDRDKKHFLKIDSIEFIDPALLETFPYHMEKVIVQQKEGSLQCTIEESPSTRRKKTPPQRIQISTAEFSAVCPFSGLPDIGELYIEYIPDRLCLELKSLKYYLLTYRNVGIYQEHATCRIFTDLQKVLQPSYLKIKLTYNIRGGMLTHCEMETNNDEKKGE